MNHTKSYKTCVQCKRLKPNEYFTTDEQYGTDIFTDPGWLRMYVMCDKCRFPKSPQYDLPDPPEPLLDSLEVHMKTCSRCGDTLPITNYIKMGFRNRRQRYSNTCRKCSAPGREYSRLKYKCKKYGITLEQYLAMSKTCEICGTDKLLVIDHDHDTGLVRGTLCVKCNTGIGYFMESVPNLKAAIRYVQHTCGQKLTSSSMCVVTSEVDGFNESIQ